MAVRPALNVLREYSETKSVWVETSDSPAFSFNYGYRRELKRELRLSFPLT